MRKVINIVLIFVLLTSSFFVYPKIGVADEPNLLTNPGAESGDTATGWTNISGSWNMTNDWDNMVHSGTRSFRSSNSWGVMEQKIDLVSAGYSALYLDASPAIQMSDWVTSRRNGKYFVTFALLASDGTTVITSNSGVGSTQANPANVAGDAPWTQVAQPFMAYGPGVRYALIRQGGYDITGWAGYYGPHFDDASITVTDTRPAEILHTLTYTAGSGGTISGSASQSVNDLDSGTAVTAVPNQGYHFVKWSDNSTTNPRTDTFITSDISVSAVFAINIYDLNYSAGDHGSISGNVLQHINYGGNGFAVTAVPAANYEFVRWSDNSTQNPRTDTNISGNINTTAVFSMETTPPTFSNLPNLSANINVTEGQTITTNPYIIKVNPSDANGISKAEFYIDDTLICTATAANSDGTYSCTWDTSKYHSIVKVYAYDNSNNRSTVLQRTTIVDPTLYKPAIAATIPTMTALPATGILNKKTTSE